MSTKKHVIQANCICYQRSIKAFLICLEDQLFLLLPTEKVSEFLDHHLKPIMQNGLSYMRDSQYLKTKIKTIATVPETTILVTAD